MQYYVCSFVGQSRCYYLTDTIYAGNKYKTPKERIGQTTHSTSDAALGEVDFDGLMELRPPTPMPRGNVGTPIKWFLGEIKACRLPPSWWLLCY